MNKKKLKRQFIEDLNKEYKIKLNFENIDEVLEGRKPASERDIKDLITLYGRKFDFDLTFVDTNNEIKFRQEIPTIKKYDLSKVVLSEIKYFEDLFNGSLFDGNLNDLKFTEKNNLTGLFENFNYKIQSNPLGFKVFFIIKFCSSYWINILISLKFLTYFDNSISIH